MLDLVLTGGTVCDGTGSPPFQADIGIKGDRIESVGLSEQSEQSDLYDQYEQRAEARITIDISGLVVSPGFIDVHSHSEFTLLADPRAEGKLLQGITTEVNGNCGLSAAPLLGAALVQREADLKEHGIPERWGSFGEYFSILSARGPALNFATLVGHGNIRASVMGYVDHVPTGEELGRMKALLEEALDAGALGLSTGLIYPPGIYSRPSEIEALAAHGADFRKGKGKGFVYASHMRSEGDRLLESIRETLQVARASGAHVNISHLKASDRTNWHKADEAIGLLEDARAEGFSISCDRYPYTASSTDLDAVLPAWMYEGGAARELERLKDSGVRARLRRECPIEQDKAGAIVVSSVQSARGRWMEGLSLAAISERRGLDPLDALCEVLVEEQLRVGAIFHVMSQENLDKFLSLPYCMVGSDSSARSLDGPTAKGKPHPRGFGSFPRFISTRTGWGGAMEEAVRKTCGLPAEVFGLEGRGVIKVGNFADLCVFDPEEILDRATYEEPFNAPSGIRHVLVNGEICVQEGKCTGTRAGRAIGA